MRSASPTIPTLFSKTLSRLPPYPGSVIFVAGLNLLLVRHLPADTLQALKGRSLRIHVTDAGIAVDFTYDQNTFRAARWRDDTDLTIAASAHDFICLLQREEDPDTLFFSRRLVMEGDTELGLMVKNTLDALDFSEMPVRRLMPILATLRHVLR